MNGPVFTIFYVADPAASAAFYADRLGLTPLEQSPTFALLALRDGVMLGLWKRDGVLPAADGTAGAGELAQAVDSDARVDDIFADWSAQGVDIVDTPTRRDFGYAFLARDPDGHRVRIFAPHAM